MHPVVFPIALGSTPQGTSLSPLEFVLSAEQVVPQPDEVVERLQAKQPMNGLENIYDARTGNDFCVRCLCWRGPTAVGGTSFIPRSTPSEKVFTYDSSSCSFSSSGAASLSTRRTFTPSP